MASSPAHRLRLDLVLVVLVVLVVALSGAACAPSALVSRRVDPKAYAGLPAAERAAGDQNLPQVAVERTLQQRATDDLAQARKQVETLAAEQKTAKDAVDKAHLQVTAAHGDALKLEQAHHDLAVAESGVAVQAARSSWLAARLRWRELGLEAATLHLAAAEANLELGRAGVMARYDSSIEVERFRGQFAQLHQRWSASKAAVLTAHREMDRTERELAAVKTRYAEVRLQPLAPPPALAKPQAPAPVVAKPQ